MIQLDPTAIAVATAQYQQLIKGFAPLSKPPTLPEALCSLEMALPDGLDAVGLLTWANAAEQLAAMLEPTQTPWIEALQTTGYLLRFRSRSLPSTRNTYG